MNLIDILNQILNTKNELREIVDENTDFSRLPVAVHNYLAEIYNKGFADGYRDKFLSETDNGSWVKNKILRREYTVDDSNYDPYTYNGLVDIMRSVLGFRLDIKDELEIDSDQFITYPDYLRALSERMYSIGYDDGQEDASTILSTAAHIVTPTFYFDRNTNTFTITSSQGVANIYYKIGENGVSIRYTGPVKVSEDCTIYYWVSIGGASGGDGSGYCDYNESVGDDTFTVQPVTISQNRNRVSLFTNTDGATILYSLNSGDWNIYLTPFDISEETIISTYAVVDNHISKTVTSTLTYYPDTNQVNKCENVELVQTNTNQITLSCPTGFSTIKYQINDTDPNSWITYSSSFTIVSQCIIYAYATKSGWEDSDILFWACTVSTPTPKLHAPMIYRVNYLIAIHNYDSGSTLYHKIDDQSEWTNDGEVNGISITPYQNCTVYAYVSKDGVDSSISTYVFNYYKDNIIIPAPELSFINNRIVITNEGYNTYYTLDGSDPRLYGTLYTGMYDGFSGIVISQPTTIRAISTGIDENQRTYYSDYVSETFTPISEDDEEFIFSDEFCNVTGTSEIHVYGVPSGNKALNWSYDKVTWTSFNDVTGLDPTKKVYLHSHGYNGRIFDYIRFGEGDSVSISGNVLSLIYVGGQNWSSRKVCATNGKLNDLFYGATTLVDASKLVIPLTSTIGGDCKNMFKDCSSLVSGPSNLYFTEVGRETCYGMFDGCSSLRTSPSFKFNSIGRSGCYRMFYNCSNLTNVSSFNLSGTVSEYGLEECFDNCTRLSKCEMNISGTISDYSFRHCFRNCVNLKCRSYINDNSYIDCINISTSSLAEGCYYGMFEGCSKLDVFGPIPGISAKYKCYERMFYNCKGLNEVQSIGLTSVHENCCYSMFEGCSSLVKAPTLLPANIDRTNSYGRMFYNCSSLNYIKANFLTDPSSGRYTGNWVYGVADEGTFVQDEDADWYEESVNAIPVGWVSTKEKNDIGIITNIKCEAGVITITASKDDTILYQLNGINGTWLEYNGPFTISTDAVVYGRCRNNRNELGPIYQSELFTISSLPLPIIVGENNMVTISNPTNYTYQKLYYRLLSYQGTEEIQTWNLYTVPFNIGKSYTVQCYGLLSNGSNGSVVSADISFGVYPPKIICSNNTVTMSCSTPNYDRIEYKVNSDTNWSVYGSPIVLDPNSTSTKFCARSVIVDVDGFEHYSESYYATCYYISGGNNGPVLYTPIVKKYGSENKLYIIYDGLAYTDWYPSEHNGIHIKYRINNGAWKEYMAMLSYSSDIDTINTCAYINSDESEIGTYGPFTYSGGTQTRPDAPVISTDDNYFSLSGIGSMKYSYDGISFFDYTSPVSYNESKWVWAYTIYNGVSSEIVSRYCEYVQAPTNIDPTFTVDETNGIITINGQGTIQYYTNVSFNHSTKNYTRPLRYINSGITVTARAIVESGGHTYFSNWVTQVCNWYGGNVVPEEPTITITDIEGEDISVRFYTEYENVEIYHAYNYMGSPGSFSLGSASGYVYPGFDCGFTINRDEIIAFAYTKSGSNTSDIVSKYFIVNDTKTEVNDTLTLVEQVYDDSYVILVSGAPAGSVIKYALGGEISTYNGTPPSGYNAVIIPNQSINVSVFYENGNNRSKVSWIHYEKHEEDVPTFSYYYDDEEGWYVITLSGDGSTIYYGDSTTYGQSYSGETFYRTYNSLSNNSIYAWYYRGDKAREIYGQSGEVLTRIVNK